MTEYYLQWTAAVLTAHGRYLQSNLRTHAACLRAVQKALGAQQDSLTRLCNDNSYTIQYLLHRAAAEEAEAGLGRVEQSGAIDAAPLGAATA